jgi:hypothetical protein
MMDNLSMRWVRVGLCGAVCTLSALTAAPAAPIWYVSVTNETTQAIGVTFTQGNNPKVIAEGTIGKFDQKSFTLYNLPTTVRISSIKGCNKAVIREVPIDKRVVVREGCDVEVK